VKKSGQSTGASICQQDGRRLGHTACSTSLTLRRTTHRTRVLDRSIPAASKQRSLLFNLEKEAPTSASRQRSTLRTNCWHLQASLTTLLPSANPKIPLQIPQNEKTPVTSPCHTSSHGPHTNDTRMLQRGGSSIHISSKRSSLRGFAPRSMSVGCTKADRDRDISTCNDWRFFNGISSLIMVVGAAAKDDGEGGEAHIPHSVMLPHVFFK